VEQAQTSLPKTQTQTMGSVSERARTCLWDGVLKICFLAFV
jgi:hypothetical protein